MLLVHPKPLGSLKQVQDALSVRDPAGACYYPALLDSSLFAESGYKRSHRLLVFSWSSLFRATHREATSEFRTLHYLDLGLRGCKDLPFCKKHSGCREDHLIRRSRFC